MKVLLDLESINELKLTPSCFVYLTLLLLKKRSLANELCDDFLRSAELPARCIKLGVLTLVNDRYELNESKFAQLSNSSDIDTFVDEYRNIFPKGVQTYGYPVKGDKAACRTKLTRFLKKYPEYNKNIILKATREYVSSRIMYNYEGLQLAHYFIDKDGISNLASMCEQNLSGNNSSSSSFEEDL